MLWFSMNLASTCTYLGLMAYTLYRYRKGVIGLSLCLVVSWAVCAIWRLSIAIYETTHPNVLTKDVMPIGKPIFWVIRSLNFWFFLVIIFRLNSLTIYMDPLHNTQEKINE